MDILPTLAQLAGATLPPGLVLDGSSLADILLGTSSSGNSTDRPVFFYRGNMLYAVRNDVSFLSAILNLEDICTNLL